VTKLESHLRFLLAPSVVVPLLLLIVSVEIWLVFNLHSILSEAWAARTRPQLGPVWGGLIFLSAIIHETSHGLVCKYFGGKVYEMGLVWRYLWFYPYCKLDYIVLFHKRRHRVFVAAAGTFVSLTLMLPFAVIWAFAPPESFLSALSALMLTFYNLSAILNLIPFVRLDGYFMLAHALGMTDLRQEAHGYIKRLTKVKFFKQPDTADLSDWERRLYLAYGIPSLVVSVGFVCLLNHVVMFYPKPIQSEQARTFRYGFVIVMLLMLAYLAALLLTQHHQSIHDLVARTLVLRSS
jgi:putative peptide zinc metalloprotease protein